MLQTLIVFTPPFIFALTLLIFGFQVRLLLLCEWLTLIPNVTPFPQISHLAISKVHLQIKTVKIKITNSLTHKYKYLQAIFQNNIILFDFRVYLTLVHYIKKQLALSHMVCFAIALVRPMLFTNQIFCAIIRCVAEDILTVAQYPSQFYPFPRRA